MTTTGPSKGSLLIHGGAPNGQIDQDTIDQFVALAGGPGANIVYIPTAQKEADITLRNGDTSPLHGFNCTVFHTRNRRTANQNSFVSVIRKASGVFIDGGRQPRLAKPYLNTKTQGELEKLVDRGGVIAGTYYSTDSHTCTYRHSSASAYIDYSIIRYANTYPGHRCPGIGPRS